jgi:hypothetical protein
MKKKRLLSASRDPDTVYTIRDPELDPGTIIITCDTEEMIKISKTGFFVRGIPVQQDDREAKIVYNAFKEFLTYNALTRNY